MIKQLIAELRDTMNRKGNYENGRFLVSYRTVDEVLKRYEQGEPVKAVAQRLKFKLSAKEKTVVRCILAGLRNADIAKELGNTEQVIKNNLQTIYRKTGLKNRLELFLFADNNRSILEP